MGIEIPSGIQPYSLGRKPLHGALHEALSKYELRKFWVTDKACEEELGEVRRCFDESKDGEKHNMVVHYLVRDGDHQAQLRLLLSIGVHPDLGSCWNNRPSHLTTIYGRPSCARELSPCRPNLAVGPKQIRKHAHLHSGEF